MFAATFLDHPLALNAVIFIAAGAGVWAAGTRLAIYADQFSKRTKVAEGLIGLLFLAAATELPEIATTFTAAITGNAQLVLNNLFGGITLNTAILAVIDGLLVRGVLTFYPRKPTHALEAALLIVMLTVLIAVCVVGDRPVVLNIGLGAIALALGYVFSINLLRHYDQGRGWLPIEVPEFGEPESDGGAAEGLSALTMRGLYALSALMIIAILVCGVLLVETADALAVQTGLGSSFVGVTLLAAATSLPELSTTIAAARLGAYTMAISNIFGSNLIMLALVLPADALYRQGPILQVAGPSEILALIAGILVTAVYVIGLLLRHKYQLFRMGADSIVVLAIYLGSLGVLYSLR